MSDVSPERLVMDARVAKNIEANQHEEPSFPVHYIRLDLHARMLAEVTDNAAPQRPPEIIVDFEINNEGQIYGLTDRGRILLYSSDRERWTDLPLKRDELP